MAQKEKYRGPDLMSKYVWLINTIYRAKRISYMELNERWKRDVGMSRGQDLPKRTLKRWLNIIEALFGIDIINERSGEYHYYIENIENIDEGGLQSWLFNTFTVSNALTGCMSIKDRIQLEYVPSGELYLQPIIDAMKENRVINLTYKSYWKESESNYDVQPLCLKLKVDADQANYLRDLKIHRSQLEVERNSEYCIFTYFLRPTFDFQQELLWNADRVEVLEPQWLRDEMADTIKKMSHLYEPDN